MSRFFSNKFNSLEPYTPGEQPKDMEYIKLNTNESPFPPSTLAVKLASEAAEKLELYPDPTCAEAVKTVAEYLGVNENEVLLTNGSDEILNFAFMAFCDEDRPAAFPDITYGFYKVFAKLYQIPYRQYRLRDDLTIDLSEYMGTKETLFIANPNAPTGLALKVWEIEALLKSNPDRLVVIDEAYVDFGCESCVPLIKKYDNLLVTQTFSKSRSMAGARLGFGVGCPELIADLNTVKYSTNPYNINRMTAAAGIGAIRDDAYMKRCIGEIISNRESTKEKLRALGFEMTDSVTNFLFVRHSEIDGEKLYEKLKERGILVRHFNSHRIKSYNRITIGSREQMDYLVKNITEIMEDVL